MCPMAYQLRTADPRTDPGLASLLDVAFGRPDCESRLVRILAEQLPSFDPGLSLVATEDERDVAYALFLPRRFFIRGAEVPLVISSPFAALPEVRGKGAARFLLDVGLSALKDRGIRGAMVLGGRNFFARNGYQAAFNLYTLDAVREATASFADFTDAEWTGLTSEDIPALHAMYAANYGDVAGSEVRSNAPIDWESSSAKGFTLIHRRAGTAVCYLRFRVREKLEIMECAAIDQQAAQTVCGFIHRLTGEHHRPTAEVHLPPLHPVFRALFNAGCMAEGNNFHNEARLVITDWKGFLEDIGQFLSGALKRCDIKSFSLGIKARGGDESWHITRDKSSVNVKAGKAQIHIDLPEGWAEPLMTGRIDWRDLLFSAGETNKNLLSQLFPLGTPMWTYSPAFDIAYE